MSVISYEIVNHRYFETQYRFRRPDAMLAGYVEYYWELDLRGLDSASEDFKENLLAHLNSSLVFNLGNAYELYDKADHLQESVSYHAIIGLQTQVHAYKHFHGNHLFGIKFKPGALNFLFSLDGRDTMNHLLDYQDVLSGTYVDEMLYEAKDLTARGVVMDNFLLKKLSAQKQHYRFTLISKALEEELVKSKDLATQLCTTEKSMERYFKQLLGVSPKKCLNILRFRKALKVYLEQGSQSDFESLGYYDLSHFRKDYVKFGV